MITVFACIVFKTTGHMYQRFSDQTQPQMRAFRKKGVYRDSIGVYEGYIGIILGLHRDNGKENGSYYLGFRV